MKKVIYSVAVVAALGFASCGGPGVCDCVSLQKDMMKELKEDGSNAKELEEKYKDKIDACKKLGEGKSDEEKKKLEEEAKNCK